MIPVVSKYIIALIAVNPNPFIDEAARLFSHDAQNYLVSKTSHPHITLAQFITTNEIAQHIKRKVFTQYSSHQAKPQVNGYFCRADKKERDTWSVKIAVTRTSDLQDLHDFVVRSVQEFCTCLNAHGEQYLPHLSMARVKEQTVHRIFVKDKLNLDLNTVTYFDQEHYNDFSPEFRSFLTSEPAFTLAFGKADERGQFIEILDRHP